jgi:hypothetical protein
MLRRSPLHRPAAVLAALALAAGVAGCGGGSGGDDSGSDSYASTWNEVCTSLSAAQTTLQSDGVAAQKKAGSTDQTALAKAFAQPVSRFADSMSAALDRVKDLDAPEEFSGFQAKVAKSAPATISVLESVKAPLAKGDVKATQAALGRIDQKNLFPAIPDALKRQATACNVY